MAGLPRQLLGTTRLVDDLPAARTLATDGDFAGCRFVTRAGELLEPDGTLTVGTQRGQAGIVLRKSELRDLRTRERSLAADATAAEAHLQERDRAGRIDAALHGLEQEVALLANRAGDLQAEIARHTQRRERLDEELALHRAESRIADDDLARVEARTGRTRRRGPASGGASRRISTSNWPGGSRRCGTASRPRRPGSRS